MTIRAFAAKGPREKLVPYEYNARPVGPYDVAIAINYCGICHSDLHLLNNEWGITQYPLVPGHEIVGTVAEAGANVRGMTTGSRVGVGWQCGACLECEWCASGNDHICPDSRATCAGNYGGFANSIVVDSRYAFVIPEGMSSENAAPLMCGGVTVYSPLRRYDVRPHMKVGVVGIGGLGHLALQFAHAFGCEVTAFSSSSDKESDALAFGADNFVDSSNPDQLAALARSQDIIIVAANADLDWQAYINILRPLGNLCFVGAVPNPIEVHAMSLIFGSKSVSGSPIGSRQMIREMLDFAARHEIEARTEVMPMNRVNEAMSRLSANQARFRIVLKN